MPGIPAAAPLQEQRRSPGLGVTSSLCKPPPDLAHRRRDIPNGKKASRSRDRISEIPTAVPFAVGLARAGGGAERSSAALVLRRDESKRMPPQLVLLLPRFSTIFPLHSFSQHPLARSFWFRHAPSTPPASPASPQLKVPGGTACLEPKPSICHSGLDPLDCRDGDPSGSHRMIEMRA